MLQIGLGEIVTVLIVSLIVLGPEHLPNAAQKLAKGYKLLKQLRVKLSQELTSISESDSKKPPHE